MKIIVTFVLLFVCLCGSPLWAQSMRDTAPEFGLAELMDPRATLYQSREAYRLATGQEPPDYNAMMPRKYWSLSVPQGQPFVTVNLPTVIIQGSVSRAIVQSATLPAAMARAVNIPHGMASEEPATEQEMRFPILELRVDEILVNTMFGVVVRNTSRYLPMTDPVQAEMLKLLRAIAAKLGVN